MIIGFNSGEAITKDMIGPNGAPALSNPKVIGIVEQAQNGVNDPTIAAKKLPNIPRFDNQSLSFSCGIYINAKATKVLIPRKRIVSSAVIKRKNSMVFVNEFIVRASQLVDMVNL